jgi:hypothetical protein
VKQKTHNIYHKILKMDKETLRMQMLAGVITEGQYKAKLEEATQKDSLNEHMIGGIVGVGAINQIPSRAQTDYEMAFEHFLGERYQIKPNRERDDIKDINEAEDAGIVNSESLAYYINELIDLADDMEYTPEMVKELNALKNSLPGGVEEMSIEDALDIMQQTIDITEDDISAIEALDQAVDGDPAVIAKAREIYGLDEAKKPGTFKKRSAMAKKARAGKDIGEKGKNFEKIAKSAAKKYGSEEAGKKVAGAVMYGKLNK